MRGTRVLVDSNVILDVVTGDESWYAWSSARIQELSECKLLVINPIVYAEVSVGFERLEDLDTFVPAEIFRREPLPWAAAFLAGKCYLSYRRSGGRRHSPLPDFYIGAHAAVRGMALLTRDQRRYRQYFPKLELIEPSAP